MGYRKQKEALEKRRKKRKRIFACFAAVLLFALSSFSAVVPPKTWKYYVNLPALKARGYGEARIHFLDVGQGDSVLLELPDGKVMLLANFKRLFIHHRASRSQLPRKLLR